MVSAKFENLKNNLFVFLPYLTLQDPAVRISVLFYTTNRCNLSCPVCYRSAGADAPEKCFPSADYKEIINAFVSDPRHMNDVCISGGEVTEIYKFDQSVAETHYLNTLIQHAFDCGLNVALKTNGLWANDKNADRIWNDLESLNFGTRSLGINCSLSPYHKNTVPAISKIMHRVYATDPFIENARLGLCVFENDHTDLDRLLDHQNLAQYGLRITSDQLITDRTTTVDINNKAMGLDLGGKFAQVGRAKKYNLGYSFDEEAALTFSTPRAVKGEPAFENLYAFDENGFVALGNIHNSPYKIRYTKPDGSIKNFTELASEFSDIMFKKCAQSSGLHAVPRDLIDQFASLTPKLLQAFYQECRQRS